MKKAITIILVITLIISCYASSNTPIQAPKYRLTIPKDIPELGMDDLLDKMTIKKIVALESSSNSMINSISDIKIVGDKIYVLDKRHKVGGQVNILELTVLMFTQTGIY